MVLGTSTWRQSTRITAEIREEDDWEGYSRVNMIDNTLIYLGNVCASLGIAWILRRLQMNAGEDWVRGCWRNQHPKRTDLSCEVNESECPHSPNMILYDVMYMDASARGQV